MENTIHNSEKYYHWKVKKLERNAHKQSHLSSGGVEASTCSLFSWRLERLAFSQLSPTVLAASKQVASALSVASEYFRLLSCRVERSDLQYRREGLAFLYPLVRSKFLS